MSGIDGRCITIARIRAGMTSNEVARQLFCSTALVGLWERGKRNPWWDQLYAILPELPKIREDGCVKYCPKASVCKKDGKCLMSTTVKAARRNKDIVEVVRCKDCIYHRPLNRKDTYERLFVEGCVWCEENNDGMRGDDFCSYGERRATNEAD